MTTIKLLWEKVHRRWVRMRFQPIRVFCFHQVSDEFEPDTTELCDWMHTEVFKKNILMLKRSYTFISLPEATYHLKHDCFRLKRYVVLTADDGWASMKNILPWLAEQNISIALFLNPSYLDGKHYRKRDSEKYLTYEEIDSFERSGNNVSVASHGWRHVNNTQLSSNEIKKEIENAAKELERFHSVIPYYAYPWGRHNVTTDGLLKGYDLIPVLMDGQGNYNDPTMIHRELLMK